jgi:hypothetical protein
MELNDEFDDELSTLDLIKRQQKRFELAFLRRNE